MNAMFNVVLLPMTVFALFMSVRPLYWLATAIWYIAFPFGMLFYWVMKLWREGPEDQVWLGVGMSLFWWVITPLAIWFFWAYDVHVRFWLS